jgi:hypothetical protein
MTKNGVLVTLTTINVKNVSAMAEQLSACSVNIDMIQRIRQVEESASHAVIPMESTVRSVSRSSIMTRVTTPANHATVMLMVHILDYVTKKVGSVIASLVKSEETVDLTEEPLLRMLKSHRDSVTFDWISERNVCKQMFSYQDRIIRNGRADVS